MTLNYAILRNTNPHEITQDLLVVCVTLKKNIV